MRVHLETAFARGYARYPFFHDMGHGHMINSPEADRRMEEARANGASEQEIWQMAYEDPGLRFLYHASEHLVLRGDPRNVPADTEFLRAHRNIVGSVAAPADIQVLPDSGGANTHGPGGSIIYLSASRTGCVPMKYGAGVLYLDFSTLGSSSPNDGARGE